eukprot:Hpha_TRINITY_DN14126_c0_g1::TRINITY_DN14126_c0_g1_i1::g.10671::m.10671
MVLNGNSGSERICSGHAALLGRTGVKNFLVAGVPRTSGEHIGKDRFFYGSRLVWPHVHGAGTQGNHAVGSVSEVAFGSGSGSSLDWNRMRIPDAAVATIPTTRNPTP